MDCAEFSLYALAARQRPLIYGRDYEHACVRFTKIPLLVRAKFHTRVVVNCEEPL
jgi:hypothetical protein